MTEKKVINNLSNTDSKKILQDVSEKDDLLYDFIHNFFIKIREPLSIVSGMSDTLSDNSTDLFNKLLKENLGILQENVKKIITLVEQSSNLSLFYTDKIEPYDEILDITSLIKETAISWQKKKAPDSVKFSFDVPVVYSRKGKKIREISTTVSDEPISIFGNKIWLKEVFEEIFENAWRYSDKPTRIQIGFEKQDNEFRIFIQDSGIGLEAEGGLTNFIPFIRGPEAIRRIPNKQGLGLSKIKAIIQKQKGTISYYPNKSGTTLVLGFSLFPMVEEEDDSFIFGFEEKKVLLFQDNEEQQKLFQNLLEFNCYKVFSINKPDELIEKVNQLRPDLVLMDSSYQDNLTIKWIIDFLTEFENIPTMILANEKDEMNAIKFLQLGIHGFLVKPIEYHKFISLINHLLRIPLNL